ncbi:MAG: branched-chain amino acid ABC transporter substrate-binding protein, partial [Caldilineaceae bacterium]|nr:branched-chain amino acid ABC transporter substrate-binding protein [Caldilineaceae bacterium]
AETVVGDRRVVGVIGTSCSVGAVEAAPILSEAGLVMISASNTAPSLTSDLRGNAGEHSHAGYYRTANNDLHQGQAVAEFAFHGLGLRRMATVDDGDPYTSGFTDAFAAAFEALGGAVVAMGQISRGESDMMPVLSRIAAESPEGLFFPIFPDEAAAIARQAGQVEGLEALVLIGNDSLLLAAPEVLGFYVVAPELRFGGNVNQATGKSGEEVAADYAARYGEAPTSASMVHAYDATTLLLRAIEAVAVVDGETLYIDRARLREALSGTRGFRGLIGEISCDGFGDCGTGRAYVVQHTDAAVTEIRELPVVYAYEP